MLGASSISSLPLANHKSIKYIISGKSYIDSLGSKNNSWPHVVYLDPSPESNVNIHQL